MQQYKRYVTVVSMTKLLKIILGLVVGGIGLSFWGRDNIFFIILAYGILPILIFQEIIFVFIDLQKYEYAESEIELKLFNRIFKRIKYDNIKAVVVSNAVATNGNGSHYPVCSNKDGIKKQYAFLTLLSKDIDITRIQKEMHSTSVRATCKIDKKFLSDLGICWFDSLKELILRTDAKIYLLEDVYWRYQKEIDEVLSKESAAVERVYIVTMNVLPYGLYRLVNSYV